YKLATNHQICPLIVDVDREAFVDLLAQRLAFYA
ncbi:pyrimidine-specific ribonucleoside hydrolase RihA, partial [Klebsiella pneumoniae]